MASDVPIDHLILAVPELPPGVEAVAELLGARPTGGGRHVGRGTANALLRVGGSEYLEVLGPDPEANGPAPAWLSPGRLGRGRLVGWAVRSSDLDRDVARLRSGGWDPGPIEAMSRESPDGLLSWRLTPLNLEEGASALPFLIDWGSSRHPTSGLDRRSQLTALELIHPEPARIETVLRLLELDLPVSAGAAPALRAWFQTPSGPVALDTLPPGPL